MSVKVHGLNRVRKTLANLPDTLQRRVLTQSVNKATRKVALPAVRAKVPIRTSDVYLLPWKDAGLKEPMLSHLSSPGALRRGIYVQAMKRSRVRVGRVVSNPSRVVPGKNAAELAIPAAYPGYYPAFLEYGFTTKSGRVVPPRPYLRGTLQQKQAAIMGAVVTEMNARIRRLGKKR